MASKRVKVFEGLVDKTKKYSLKEAITILKKAPKAKFDESVDLAIKLDIDPKQSEQMVRGTIVLPHGTGKTKRVAVFCKGEAQHRAKEAGAEHVGAEDLIEKVSKGFLEFDVAVATPEMMRDLSKLGKVLGPKGLMPNPKAGTVTDDVAKAVKEVRAGKVEFKMDKISNINISVAKASFEDSKIYENAYTLIEAVHHARPATLKGSYIRSISISTTMGPGVRLDLSNLARG
ncbi:MAG: 50S ribosomal protein L1 [Omnitrophica WOR_2 bacterium RIFCSPHIGHO2_01_FULL_49_10]|nr:MAG: 50S ribosomal protein L1 [Omnitrophica WOR_2 bacterium RIFCSPHIGHO2_01_FULL_49_10]